LSVTEFVVVNEWDAEAPVTVLVPRSASDAPGLPPASSKRCTLATLEVGAPNSSVTVAEVSVQEFVSVLKDDPAHAPGLKFTNDEVLLSEETRVSACKAFAAATIRPNAITFANAGTRVSLGKCIIISLRFYRG
jgi:hypothetical protein